MLSEIKLLVSKLALAIQHSLLSFQSDSDQEIAFVHETLIYCIRYVSLTVYRTIPRFNEPEKGVFENIVGKGKMLVTNIFSLPHNLFKYLHPP